MTTLRVLILFLRSQTGISRRYTRHIWKQWYKKIQALVLHTQRDLKFPPFFLMAAMTSTNQRAAFGHCYGDNTMRRHIVLMKEKEDAYCN